MNWKEKISIGMKLISEGCRDADDDESTGISPCFSGCPFTDYCAEVANVAREKNIAGLNDWDN